MYNQSIEELKSFPIFITGPANQVTSVRAALTLVLAGVLVAPRLPDPRWCIAAAAIVTVLDGVDGWLAHRTRTASDFGARFDMETDALLILVLSLLAWRFGKAGAWVIASGLIRYVFVAAGSLLSWLQRPLPPSKRRQTVCVMQVTALIIVMLPTVPPRLSTLIAAAALAVLVWSFLVDITWLWRRAQIQSRHA
jgi:phosphatidylglycerophosphate synthase